MEVGAGLQREQKTKPHNELMLSFNSLPEKGRFRRFCYCIQIASPLTMLRLNALPGELKFSWKMLWIGLIRLEVFAWEPERQMLFIQEAQVGSLPSHGLLSTTRNSLFPHHRAESHYYSTNITGCCPQNNNKKSACLGPFRSRCRWCKQ